MERVKALVYRNKGADVNDHDDNDIQTPLYYASKHGHLDIVEFLVESGANRILMIFSLWTTLHYAAQQGHVEIVKYLVSDVRTPVPVKETHSHRFISPQAKAILTL